MYVHMPTIFRVKGNLLSSLDDSLKPRGGRKRCQKLGSHGLRLERASGFFGFFGGLRILKALVFVEGLGVVTLGFRIFIAFGFGWRSVQDEGTLGRFSVVQAFRLCRELCPFVPPCFHACAILTHSKLGRASMFSLLPKIFGGCVNARPSPVIQGFIVTAEVGGRTEAPTLSSAACAWATPHAAST